MIAEFGTDTLPGAHNTPPEMWTEEYQVEYLRRYLDVAAKRPFVAGMHVWNFADFKTGQGTSRAGGMNSQGRLHPRPPAEDGRAFSPREVGETLGVGTMFAEAQ